MLYTTVSKEEVVNKEPATVNAPVINPDTTLKSDLAKSDAAKQNKTDAENHVTGKTIPDKIDGKDTLKRVVVKKIIRLRKKVCLSLQGIRRLCLLPFRLQFGTDGTSYVSALRTLWKVNL